MLREVHVTHSEYDFATNELRLVVSEGNGVWHETDACALMSRQGHLVGLDLGTAAERTVLMLGPHEDVDRQEVVAVRVRIDAKQGLREVLVIDGRKVGADKKSPYPR